MIIRHVEDVSYRYSSVDESPEINNVNQMVFEKV
jgi:hypothetical protein